MFDLPWIFLFMPWSLAWWGFLLVLLFCSVASTHDDDTVALAVVVTALGAAMYTLFGPGLDVLAWIAANPKTVAIAAAAYGALGVGWCCFKWFGFSVAARETYIRLKGAYVTARKDEDRDFKDQSEEDYIRTRWPYRLTFDESDNPLFRPAAKVYKARVAHWVLYWPLSVLWTGLEEWIIALKDLIFECIGGLLNKISAWAWRGVDFK